MIPPTFVKQDTDTNNIPKPYDEDDYINAYKKAWINGALYASGNGASCVYSDSAYLRLAYQDGAAALDIAIDRERRSLQILAKDWNGG